MSAASIHPGHADSSTRRPLVNTGLGYLKRNSNMPLGPGMFRFVWLVSHAVNDVVQSYAKSHGCKYFWIVGIIGPLPGVAQMHVVTDRHHNPPLVVTNRTPLRLISIFLVCAPRAYKVLPRNLQLVVNVIESVKYLITT